MFKKFKIVLILPIILFTVMAMVFGYFKLNQVKATPSEGINDPDWGVLAINTDKSIYQPGEIARLEIAVLDNNSQIICDADLKLKINHKLTNGEIKETKLTTQDKTIKVNEACQIHDRTTQPDYETEYKVEEPGLYQVELLVKTQNGIRLTQTSFVVQESVPFDIQRNISTRIYPPKPYPVAINIKANQDYIGLVSEKVPNDFNISSSLDFPSYSFIDYDKNGQKRVNWAVSLKKGEGVTLGYRFTAPQKVPEFYTFGPLIIGSFQETRKWQLAADAVVAPNIITMWPSTSGTIPTGWTRKTELDGYFIESGIGAGSTNPELNIAKGSATHSHTSPVHSHTIGHTHTVPSLAALDVAPHSPNGTGASLDTHTHASADSATSSINIGSSNGVNNTGIWGTAPNNPPYTSVIFIKSNGTNKIANGAWAFFYSTAPSGWASTNANQYVKGAATGGDGGSTGGNATHSHTDSGHTHTESAHSHSGYSPTASNNQSIGGAGTTYAPYVHSHLVTSDLVVATEASGIGLGATNNGEPFFIKVNTIQNNTPGGLEDLPDNVIAIWTGTTASIPSPWYLCDGTNSTPNLNIGRFIKGADTDVGIGTTGGNSTHTHAAGAAHTHTINNHVHTFTVGTNTGTGVGAVGNPNDTNAQGHTHASVTSTTSGGSTGEATVTADANTDNRPLYKNVYLIQYHTPKITVSGRTDVTSGNIALAVNGNLQSSTAPISSGTWSISNVSTPNADDIVTTWISGATDANKSTAVTKYDGSGNITDMILNKNVLSIGSSDTSPSINVTNLGLYDYDQTTDIIHQANSNVLTVDPGSPRFTDEKLDILATTTLSIGNGETANTHNITINGILTSGTNSSYNISGSWDNNNTFNASSSTVYFNASSGTETIDSTGAGTSIFNNVQHVGASTLQLDSNLDVNGNFTQTTGTLNCNGKNQNYAGDFYLSSGTTYQKGGALTFDGSGTSIFTDLTSGQQDLGAVTINGSSKTINTNTSLKLTTLSIDTDDALNITDDNLTILGNGAPFTKNGALTTASSTVIYAGTAATNITTATYNNLTLTPASSTPTFSLTGNLTAGTALSGNLTISTGATLDVTAANYGIGLSGNWNSSAGTFTPQNGTVTFGKGSATQTVNNGSSSFWHVIHSGAGTMQLDTNGIDVNGDFSQTAGGFNAGGLNQNYAGGFSLSLGTTYQKGGTLTFDGSVSADVADATTGQQDLGAVVVDGSSKPITTSNNMKLTTLTIGANDSLDISSDTLTILGSGTPFTITTGGAFTTTGSTVIYAGTTATNITTTLYNNLTVDPASGTPTYSLTGHLTTTNALTGNLTISNDGALDTTGSNYSITLASNWSNAGTFTPQNSTVTFSKTSLTQTVNNGSSSFWHVVHSGAGTIQLDTNGIDVNGDFSQTAGGFNAGGLNQNYAGGFSLSLGTTYQKGGILTFDGSVSSAVSDATTGQQDLGAVVVDGASKPVTTSTNMRLTTLTIGANDSLDISNDILTILGSGTPFTITTGGAFTTTSSTVIYAGTTNTNVKTTLYNNLTFTPASGAPTFSLTGNLTGGSAMNGDLTINSSANLDTVSGSNYGITLAGSWDNNGTFTAQNSMVTFNATSGSKTIEAGSSAFYDVVFNSSSGTWTIQTDNLTANRNFTVTDVSSLAIAASKTVEVDGTYSVVDAEADDITWNSNSVLYLKSGTPYTVGSKNQAVATYAILQIGANADIRLWNSTASTFTIITGGSLYSQDHANVNGDLYIWGDYHTQTAENPDHDYWSYAVNFDGTNLSGGSERQVDVRIDPSSNVTVDSGDTLAAIGTSPNRTTIDRQGAVNGYGLTSAGGTINFEYTNFDHLDGNKGLDIQTSSNVTSLNYTTFNNLVGTTAPDDAFMTVASLVIDSGTFPITGISISNSGSGAEFNVNRTGSDYAGYWDFDASTGDFDGEAFDGKNGANEADPGMLRWDDSNKNPIAPTDLLTEGATNPTNVTDETPEFSAVFNDLDIGDTANAYQIQVDDDINFGSPIWDSTKTALSPTCLQGNRCTDISYAGSALTHGTQYYWKIKFWDIGDLEGTWSTGSNYFIINNAPLSPTVLWTEGQANPSSIHDTTPEFSAIYNDADTSDIANFYQIQVDDDPGFGSPLWDSAKTALSPTCNQGNRCTDISYSGSALSQGVTYYWQIKYWDDGGLAGAWSTGSNYFTLSQAPTAPTDLLTEGATNPVNISDTTPEFSAVFNDLDTGDTANAYQIQVDDNQDFGSSIWDSGQQSMTNCNQGSRCQDISYSGSALTEGTQYYWQIKYWDDGGLAGAWSTGSNYFIINSTPLAPNSLLTEGQTNPTDVSDTTPEFSAVYNDPNTSDIANKYRIQVNIDPTFVGAPIWDSGEAGTSMTNCNQSSRCEDISYTGSTLAEQTRYYWRIKYWDDGGLEGAWSTEEAYFELVATINQFRFRDIRVKDLRIKPTN